MVFAVLLLLATAAAGAAAGRWTRLHPLLSGAVVAVPAAAIGLLVGAGAMSPAALAFAGVSWVLGAAVGSLGAFIGWLRRQHIGRMQ